MSLLEEVGNVPAGTSRRIAVVSSRVLMTHDETGRILDVGRRTRAISPALSRALADRDGHCRFPGCDSTFCDAHHIEHWADGGETRLDNLVLLCRRHHRFVHEDGWRVILDAAAEVPGKGHGKGPQQEPHEVRFVGPDGCGLPMAPPLPALGREIEATEGALAMLGELMDELGVDWSADASEPAWDGSRLDLSWALDVLRSPR